MSQRVTALFPTRDDAERAASALMDHGVTREEISLLARGPIRGVVPDPADPKALTYTSDADVAAGAAAGAGVGGVLGLLATAAMLVVPGLGPVVAAGTLAAALATGTAIGGSRAAWPAASMARCVTWGWGKATPSGSSVGSRQV